jgi:hypothetical protein
MLQVTNGDTAAARIREAGLPGELLPWRDVLHEGPVPAGLSNGELREVRARFLAQQEWGDYRGILKDFVARDASLGRFRDHSEVVLWFEHDLYDQLQLIQVLAFFADTGEWASHLRAALVAEYVGSLEPVRVRSLFEARRPVSRSQVEVGRRAWEAFRAPVPTEIVALLNDETGVLPYLGPALARHLEEYPSTRNGLSRSERQILEALSNEPRTLGKAFRAAHHEREDSLFLGDTVFAAYVERLGDAAHALVRCADGAPVASLRSAVERRRFWDQRVATTNLGRAVLLGEEDWIRIAGIDRWLGGVHLQGHESAWRWDDVTRTIVPTLN